MALPEISHWSLEDIDWGRFEADKVDPVILSVIKTAALVEYNSPDYVAYLLNVFSDQPPEFEASVRRWGMEEAQHGKVLARWAQLADPDFDFDKALKRFQAGYSLPLEVTQSIRGSRAGEWVARCVVETGTSSLYSALRDKSDEPVLKQIASHLARDEFRHYRLFFNYFQEFDQGRMSRWARLKVALGRILETDDDELAYAYFCANFPDLPEAAYNRNDCANSYHGRVLWFYRRGHVNQVTRMVANVAGFNRRGLMVRALSRLAWWAVARKGARVVARAA